MNNKTFAVSALSLIAVIVYLFVTAPPPLPESTMSVSRHIPIEDVFKIVEAENDMVREIYTKEIVGAGLKAGLKFAEEWREDGVEAGPLPALFLRGTAAVLEKSPVRLSLFLGSDFPINASNHFSGTQKEAFRWLKETRKPQFFKAEDTGLQTAMFADKALAQACVDCHNDHVDSPKTDWKLGEMMGATTWSHPREKVSTEEFLAILGALRKGFKETYSAYLEKANQFNNPPAIGNQWPRDGFFLPSAETFMEELSRRSSSNTLKTTLLIMDAVHDQS